MTYLLDCLYTYKLKYYHIRMKLEMKIENNPRWTFRQVIKTLPLMPYELIIQMNANGISIPSESEEQEERHREYVFRCVKEKIIPYSEMKLEYRECEGILPTFSPSNFSAYPNRHSLRFIEDRILHGIFNGDRVNKVVVYSQSSPGYLRNGPGSGEKGFIKFRDSLLDMFLERNYEPTYARLLVPDSDRCSLLEFKREEINDTKKGVLELDWVDNVDKDRREILKVWFKNLKEKYDSS